MIKERNLLLFILASIILLERGEPFSIREPIVARSPLHFEQPSSKVIFTISDKNVNQRCSIILKSSKRNENQNIGISDRAQGFLVLMTVPLAWGTYVPVVRYLYEIQPPVPGFVFSAAYYSVASLTLIFLVCAQIGQLDTMDEHEPDSRPPLTVAASSIDSRLPIVGGLELGTYLFLGNGLQILGLKTVSSDRAGFLVQLTTVMVPLVSGALEGKLTNITAKTWIACLLAFGGVIVMGMDGTNNVVSFSALLAGFSQGDLLIIMAAFVYTLHVVRLGKYARDTTPFKLGACKATTEAVLSISLVAFLVSVGGDSTETGSLLYAQEAGREILTFFSIISEKIASGAIPSTIVIPAVGATLWTGWVTCAYTISAQTFGQSRLGPTEANLIYSMQPLFTALFAWWLLGETLGSAGVVGGALIASAIYLVAYNMGTEEQEKRQSDVPGSKVEEPMQ
jgi:drug/metabolite transporter (DMT)-like permease